MSNDRRRFLQGILAAASCPMFAAVEPAESESATMTMDDVRDAAISSLRRAHAEQFAPLNHDDFLLALKELNARLDENERLSVEAMHAAGSLIDRYIDRNSARHE